MKTTGGVLQVAAGIGSCTTVAGAVADIPMIIFGANMAIEGISDIWNMLRGDLDAKSINLIKEATGHKSDNIVDLTELVVEIGSAKAVVKTTQAAAKTTSSSVTKASSELRGALNKAKGVVTSAR